MHTADGIINVPSRYSVSESLDRLEAVLRDKEIKVFARIDHGGEAERTGLPMRATQVLIFGNPKAGTPLMIAQPLVAIDLPMKALAWQDENGEVWLSYNDAEYLGRRFGLGDDLLKPISGIGRLIEQAAG